jgi:hypothetical protein
VSVWAALQRYARRLTVVAAQRWAPTLVFLAIGPFVDASRSWSMQGMWPQDGVLTSILGYVAAALGTALAAALPWSGWRSALASILATLMCVAVSLWLLFVFRGDWISSSVTDRLVLSNAAFALRAFWFYSLAGLLFAAFCAAREREAEMLMAARNAELECANTQHALLESRLQVLQAKIDPALLFDGLADVHRLYRLDPTAAVARLDDLIVYLRAALARTRP